MINYGNISYSRFARNARNHLLSLSPSHFYCTHFDYFVVGAHCAGRPPELRFQKHSNCLTVRFVTDAFLDFHCTY